MVLRFSAMALPPGLSLREAPSMAVRLPPPERPRLGEDEQKPFMRESEDFGLRLIQMPAGGESMTGWDRLRVTENLHTCIEKGKKKSTIWLLHCL